jgi:hypothetical protein
MQTVIGVAISICCCHPGKRRGDAAASIADNHPFDPDWCLKTMAQINFRVQTRLAPEAVLAALTDFGPSRAKVWPNIDAQHFKLHAKGPGWAEVTEGSSVAGGVWEREKYSWDASNGTVTVETLDSNTWGQGSRWNYKIAPNDGGGSVIYVSVSRRGKGVKGRLIELGLLAAGTRMLRSQMIQAMERSVP